MVTGKNNWFLKGIILFLILSGTYLLCTFINYNAHSQYSEIPYFSNNHSDAPVGEITAGTYVVQTISVDEALSSIDIMFATYARENEGQVKILIQGDTSGEIYAEKVINAHDINDNAYLSVELQPVVSSEKDDNLTISITSNSPLGSAVTIWSSADDVIDGDLFINGLQLSGDLTLKANFIKKQTYWEPIKLIHIYYILIFSFIISYIILNSFPKIQLSTVQSASSVTFASPKYGICWLILALATIIAYIVWKSTSGTYTELQSNRWEFYVLVFLLLIFVRISIKNHIKLLYALAIVLTMVWAALDTDLNVIDEGAHLGIIDYIIDNSHFPPIQDNYEAVQGPVYYYLLASILKLFPQNRHLLLGRMAGVLCVVVFGYFTKKMLDKLSEYQVITVPEEVKNILWLLFVSNPCLLTRGTRISNESLVLALSSIFLYLLTILFLKSYNNKLAILCTVICAVSFLTKSTTAFLFGGCIALFVYYKKWLEMAKNVAIFFVLVFPWFAYNYFSFGSFTQMKGHLDFVLPIVNPNRLPINIAESLVHYFDNYFFNIEVGYWYDYSQLNTFVSTAFLLLMCIAAWKMVKLVIFLLKKRLNFSYSPSERKRIVFVIYVLLPIAAMSMHAVSSCTTLNNSLAINRYMFIVNGVLCSILLMGLSKIPECLQNYVKNFLVFVFSFLNIAAIYGYLQIIIF